MEILRLSFLLVVKHRLMDDLEPLVCYNSYENCLGYGLLPTPNISPLRKAIWVSHPLIELEHALNLAKKERAHTLLFDSQICKYVPGIYLQYLISIYGEKISRISFDADEANKVNLENQYTPRTVEIYNMLESQLLSAAHDACRAADRRKGR